MYSSLPQINPKNSEFPISENTSRPNNMPMEFLSEVVFAGGIFWNLEAVFGRVDGVLKTATGNCGGTVEKPTYREVCEGTTGHTEAVKVIYDNRKISYKSLLDSAWDFHDPTNKNYLEEERKQAQESKIRRQMKLNKKIVTKIIAFDTGFYMAENHHQKYYLQKQYRLCESLSLRNTEQFVESNIASKLYG
ncbi:hypothetical protein ACB098_01G184500 [Castanea mollissima]